MIYKNKTDARIERAKKKLHLTGDVYVVDHHIASLASHRKAYPQSKATTIEGAEAEFRKFRLQERLDVMAAQAEPEEPEAE